MKEWKTTCSINTNQKRAGSTLRQKHCQSQKERMHNDKRFNSPGIYKKADSICPHKIHTSPPKKHHVKHLSSLDFAWRRVSWVWSKSQGPVPLGVWTSPCPVQWQCLKPHFPYKSDSKQSQQPHLGLRQEAVIFSPNWQLLSWAQGEMLELHVLH